MREKTGVKSNKEKQRERGFARKKRKHRARCSFAVNKQKKVFPFFLQGMFSILLQVEERTGREREERHSTSCSSTAAAAAGRAPCRRQRPRAGAGRRPHRRARRRPRGRPDVPGRGRSEGPPPRSLPGGEVVLLFLSSRRRSGGRRNRRRVLSFTRDVGPLVFVVLLFVLFLSPQSRAHRRCPGSRARVEDTVNVTSVRKKRSRSRRRVSGF